MLDQAVRIILATDSDAPGQALAEELARRLGRDRCWRVRWPTTDDKGDQQGQAELARKDANEVLMKDGREELHRLVAAAEPYPIRGLFKCAHSVVSGSWYHYLGAASFSGPDLLICRISDFFEDIWASYTEQDSQEQGVSTGWRGLDPYYRVRTLMAPSDGGTAAEGRSAALVAVQVVPGELSIVTGVPNSGKSEWIDALLCNLAEQCGWSFAMCSMEKKACTHALLLRGGSACDACPVVHQPPI